jgi:hypothetical protein
MNTQYHRLNNPAYVLYCIRRGLTTWKQLREDFGFAEDEWHTGPNTLLLAVETTRSW